MSTKPAEMAIRALHKDDLEPLARLFDQYRVFYRQASDPEAARSFIAARLARGDAALLGAFVDGDLAGFTQLYPSYTSVGMARIWILNDLYVREDARRLGVATALMDAAREFGAMTGARRLVLATEVNNTRAQRLYEKLGYRREEDFYVYELELED